MRKETEYKDKVYGVGTSKAGIYKRNKKCPAYQVWVGMLQRCYEVGYEKKKKGYENVSVCADWLDYQVFAHWYMEQKGATLGWQIDKDLLYNEQGLGINKIYCPELCLLLPERLNKAIQSEVEASVEIRGNSFRARIKDVNSKTKSLGTFKTKDEAIVAYKKAKIEKIRELIEPLLTILPTYSYNALYNYNV